MKWPGSGRVLAAVAALVALAALGLQLGLIMGKLGPAFGLWRFLGYFTILTNLLVALVAGAQALGRGGPFARPGVRLTAAAGIVLVGAAYSLFLRAAWDPQGLQKMADVALHDLVPVLMVLAWLAGPHGELRWPQMVWAAAWPLAYVVYAMLRGAADGWYAYHFLDPTMLGPLELAAWMAALLALFAMIAGGLVAVDRALAARGAQAARSVPPGKTE